MPPLPFLSKALSLEQQLPCLLKNSCPKGQEGSQETRVRASLERERKGSEGSQETRVRASLERESKGSEGSQATRVRASLEEKVREVKEGTRAFMLCATLLTL